jgi:hypothetical protein
MKSKTAQHAQPGMLPAICALLTVVLLAVFTPSAFTQQQGGAYVLNPSVVAGGGGSSSNGNTGVEGTIGAGLTGNSSGGAFALDSGFWPAAVPCLSLSARARSFTASGGAGIVDLSGLAACAWTTVNHNPEFITITSGSNGHGNGVVTYSVASHTNTTRRIGTITIAGQTFTVLQGAAFLDIPIDHPFYTEIGKLSAWAVTLGCGGDGNYCPEQSVTREQMAAFIMRARGEYNPPTPPSQRFNDVPPLHPFYNFIERLAVLQITLGCSANPPLYCPSHPVLREQMAAFIIRGLHEPGYESPPPAQQRFQDVPPGNPFYAPIDEMAVRGITLGCSANPPLYCPGDSVTRAQMAAFLVRAFGL